MAQISPATSSTEHRSWQEALAPYARPHVGRSALDLATSVVPYLALSVGMYLLLGVSYPLALVLAVPAAGFLLRTYIVFHDCAHGSFLPSKRGNAWLGTALGLLVFAPFVRWRHDHAVHHATSGTWIAAASEISRQSRSPNMAPCRRGGAGLPAHPQPGGHVRPRAGGGDDRRTEDPGAERPSPNAAQRHRDGHRAGGAGRRAELARGLARVRDGGAAPGVAGRRRRHLAVLRPAPVRGRLLAEHSDWNYADAALRGSSYLKLAKPLQFFTGNIGLHHIHHLNARIPNYNLQRAHDDNPLFHGVPTLSLWQALRAVRLKLWDEDRARLVTFADGGKPQ